MEIAPGCTGMCKSEHVVEWKRITDFVHARQQIRLVCSSLMLDVKEVNETDVGGDYFPLDSGNWPLIAPTPDYIAQIVKCLKRWIDSDMDRICAAFVKSTQMAADTAGFDLIELHFAHGYYFLSSLQLRIGEQMAMVVRLKRVFVIPWKSFGRYALWPEEAHSVRISATDWIDGGWTGDDSVILTSRS